VLKCIEMYKMSVYITIWQSHDLLKTVFELWLERLITVPSVSTDVAIKNECILDALVE